MNERHDNVESIVDAHIANFTRRIPAIEAYGNAYSERVKNMTTEDWARAAATAYRNIKYDTKTITVLNAETGLPIEGASVQVYENDWYSYRYNPSAANYTLYTNANGTTTEEGNFKRDEYYYFNVSAPGMVSNTSDNFWPEESGSIEETYILTPVPSTPASIEVELTWTTARDFDFSVVATDYDSFSRNADRMSAPGGEMYTMSALHGSETLLAYAYFFSNDVTFSTANPTVTFKSNGVVYDTVSYNDASSPYSYGDRYWLAACFDAYQNV